MLDDIPVSEVGAFERAFLAFIGKHYDGLRKEIQERKILGDEGEATFKEAIKRFKKTFAAEQAEEPAAASA